MVAPMHNGCTNAVIQNDNGCINAEIMNNLAVVIL
jgi:hypothetical protein